MISISKAARKFLAKENAEQYLKEVPEVLDSKQLDEYDLIIVMEPRHKVVVLSKCPEPKVRVMIPMYEPLEVVKCEKCRKLIAEPKELIRIEKK